MEYFVEELKSKKIIGADDIQILKNYIDKKYIKTGSKEKAKMLSKTIHHILDENLKELPENYRQAIKLNILKETLFKNKESIFMYDIFNYCMKNEFLKKNFKKELTQWINSNIESKIQEIDLNNYEKNVKKDMPSLSDKCSKNTFNYILPFDSNPLKFSKKILAVIIVVILIMGISGKFILKSHFNIAEFSQDERTHLEDFIDRITLENYEKNFPNVYLPEYLKYQDIDKNKLKSYLSTRNSLLCKEPYFSTIINTSKEFNLNPILLFAITGQEQNFVPVNTPNAYKIANNPFNVYHSWQEYNTDIGDSSRIAAHTIINLSINRPKENNPFMWIGKKYAEDQNWGNGVQSIFEEINHYYSVHSER
ncbi:hypothetical protein [Clostridium luticellarii]|jgi:hypothetical protein|uniref:hypothetical protein n=1 Tax=Clostridium luticellarii TaxID=1691940 RepID=UPI0023570797|nr:hypothetical protein [Clostridium luticellarii]MCI1944872.1 hypothetical protein [Clostridium luticellarii]MCI1968312.1 hypothetical protein [Clostridium luticellarii]MCI1995310.1 hypothetical protein [Clostridium luticellarii]MCI2039428.1 hypothetical protein [Clostridium luticellarii]